MIEDEQQNPMDPLEEALAEIAANPKAIYFIEWLFTAREEAVSQAAHAEPAQAQHAAGRLSTFEDILNIVSAALPKSATVQLSITRNSAGVKITAAEPEAKTQ